MTVPQVVSRSENSDANEAPESPAENDDASLKVLKVQNRDGQLKVLLEGGQDRGILPGTILQAQRDRDIPIPTALLKTTEVRETYTLADVTADGSEDSLMHFPDYPGIMVGDRAVAQNIEIIQRTQLIPHVGLVYKDLFVDPKASPNSYELSAAGRALLVEKARIFASIRSPLLIVEAHTDAHGDRETNQMESYQRALTIRQVLAEELGFDPERIAAIGMGETEPLEEAFLPGREDESRRIILKVKSASGE